MSEGVSLFPPPSLSRSPLFVRPPFTSILLLLVGVQPHPRCHHDGPLPASVRPPVSILRWRRHAPECKRNAAATVHERGGLHHARCRQVRCVLLLYMTPVCTFGGCISLRPALALEQGGGVSFPCLCLLCMCACDVFGWHRWHLGFTQWQYTPTFRGFDSFYGFYNCAEDYYFHGLTVHEAGV